MSCKEMTELIHPWLDHELDPVRSLEIEEHLKACPSCQRNAQSHESLRTAVASRATRFTAPPTLKRQVHSALRSAARAEAPRTFKLTGWVQELNLARYFFPAAMTAMAIFLALLLVDRPSDQELWAQAVVSAQVRSLIPNHLMDVASSDQHTVKPWFNGKLDYSPPVVDLVVQGFPLVGARLDYLRDRRLGVLVYQHGNHFINLFIWPASSGDRSEKTLTRQGYHIMHWIEGGMNCWAVSEIKKEDLEQFVQSFQKAEIEKAKSRSAQ